MSLQKSKAAQPENKEIDARIFKANTSPQKLCSSVAR